MVGISFFIRQKHSIKNVYLNRKHFYNVTNTKIAQVVLDFVNYMNTSKTDYNSYLK